MIPEFLQVPGPSGLIAVIGLAGSIFIVAGIVHLVFSLLLKHSRRDSRDALDTRMLRAFRGPVVLFLVSLGIFSVVSAANAGGSSQA